MNARFWLSRAVDHTGISGIGRVAAGIRFSNGKAALTWLTAHTSVTVYDSMVVLAEIHCHAGATRIEWIDEPGAVYARGHIDCTQDDFENCKFASIGGLDARAAPVRPPWIDHAEAPAYMDGYLTCAAQLYGHDWRTCEFAWVKALTIPAEPGVLATVCAAGGGT